MPMRSTGSSSTQSGVSTTVAGSRHPITRATASRVAPAMGHDRGFLRQAD
jgi:hypothetical protein